MKLSALATLGATLAILAGPALAADTPAAPAPMHHDYFDGIDTNHDGFISREEWRASGDKIFDAMDTNHDGKVSREEMKAYYAAKDAARKARRDAWLAQHAKSADAPGKAPASK